MRAIVAIAFVFAAAFAVDCSNNSSSDSNPPPTIATSKDNFCDQIAQVACYDLYQCCTQGQADQVLGITQPETVAQCKTDVTRLCDVQFAQQINSVQHGRATFDAAMMDACLKALVAPDGQCAAIGMDAQPWVEACQNTTLWTGLVADGGTCNFNYECANTVNGTSFCDSRMQKCTPLPTAGQMCDAGRCAKGNYCNGGTCAAQLPAGSACATDVQCQQGLFCDLAATPPVCSAPHDPGQPCDSNKSCKNNECLPGTCNGGFGGTCTSDPACGKFCSNSPTTQCSQSCGSLGFGGCGEGHCSITTTLACCLNTDCGATGGTCVLPTATCNAVQCTGDIVCANVELTVDYCLLKEGICTANGAACLTNRDCGPFGGSCINATLATALDQIPAPD